MIPEASGSHVDAVPTDDFCVERGAEIVGAVKGLDETNSFVENGEDGGLGGEAVGVGLVPAVGGGDDAC